MKQHNTPYLTTQINEVATAYTQTLLALVKVAPFNLMHNRLLLLELDRAPMYLGEQSQADRTHLIETLREAVDTLSEAADERYEERNRLRATRPLLNDAASHAVQDRALAMIDAEVSEMLELRDTLNAMLVAHLRTEVREEREIARVGQ